MWPILRGEGWAFELSEHFLLSAITDSTLFTSTSG